jgi:Flp pilus assembly protein TadD
VPRLSRTSRNIFDEFAPLSKVMMAWAQHEARLRSRRQITAADMLIAIAAQSSLLVSSVGGNADLTAARLRDVAPAPGDGAPVAPTGRIPLAEEAKPGIAEAAAEYARRGTGRTGITPYHLLAGLLAAPGSTAISTLAAAGADVEGARRRMGLILDDVYGPVTGPAAAAGPRASADDAARVAPYLRYRAETRKAVRLMAEERFGEAAGFWAELAERHPSEQEPPLRLARCLISAERWDEATAPLRQVMAVTRPEEPMGAEARNIFAWSSVVRELLAEGAVDEITLGEARRAAEEAVACFPESNYTDALALIRVLDGDPGAAARMLEPIVTRSVPHQLAEHHLAMIETTSALAHGALGDVRAARRLVSTARRRKVAPHQARFRDWAAGAVLSGRIPGNPPPRAAG